MRSSYSCNAITPSPQNERDAMNYEELRDTVVDSMSGAVDDSLEDNEELEGIIQDWAEANHIWDPKGIPDIEAKKLINFERDLTLAAYDGLIASISAIADKLRRSIWEDQEGEWPRPISPPAYDQDA